MNSKNKKDIPLLAIISVFSLGSAATTIKGALEILPASLGYPLGGGVQFILFLMLSGSTVKNAPIRKYLTVCTFSFFSVYTSFFTYYLTLTEDTNKSLNRNKIAMAREELISEVLTPLENELSSLKSLQKIKEEEIKKEINGEMYTGFKGFGQKAKQLTREAQILKTKSAKLESLVNRLEPKFYYDTDALTPEQILTKDIQALAAVPAEHRKNLPSLKRSQYIDEEQDISLLMPYYKLRRGEPAALVSLALAMTVDGFILILGTAIPLKRKSSFEVVSHFIAGFIIEFKNSLATIGSVYQKQGIVFDSPRRDELSGFDDPVMMITLRLKGKGSTFLIDFYDAIDPKSRLINDSEFQQNRDKIRAMAFRALIDVLRSPKLGWVKLESDSKWLVEQDSYWKMSRWLQQEIVRLSEEEEHSKVTEEMFLKITNTVALNNPGNAYGY